MKFPDIAVDDVLDKNIFSLNQMKQSAKEGISKKIVDMLGIGTQDLVDAPQDEKKSTEKNLTKLNDLINELLTVSKKTESHLKRIAEILEKGVSPLVKSSAKVNVSGATGYADLPKGKGEISKRGGVVQALTTKDTISALKLPRKKIDNLEVLDKDGNVISKPPIPLIPALPAPGNLAPVQGLPANVPPVTPPPIEPNDGGGMPIPSMGGKIGGAITNRVPILLGAAAADTALGMAGVGGKEINDVQDEENWNRMSAFQKAQSGFARGVEKVGTVFGMGNMANEARYQRVMNETNYFRNIDDAKKIPPMPKMQPGTDSKPIGLAQVLDERDKRMKEAAQVGPSRTVMEEQQAAANQAADYKAAGETMSAAGFTTVTGRKVLKLGSKEMEAADFENAQQAQAAREAVMRGGRRQTPIPPRPDIVEPPTKNTPKLETSNVGPNWKTKVDSYTEESSPVSHLEKPYPGISNIFIELAKKSKPASDSPLSIEIHERSLKNMAIEKAKGNAVEGLGAKPTETPSLRENNLPPVQSQSQDSVVTPLQPQAPSTGYETKDSTVSATQPMGLNKGFRSAIIPAAADAKRSDTSSVRGAAAEIPTSSGMFASNQRPTDLQSQVSNSSAENRDLSREEYLAPVQPIIMQNNNNMATQSFVPTPAQPRTSSSFSRYQERNSVY